MVTNKVKLHMWLMSYCYWIAHPQEQGSATMAGSLFLEQPCRLPSVRSAGAAELSSCDRIIWSAKPNIFVSRF